MLRRQDSNLNYLNQNQRCCRLHHDGLRLLTQSTAHPLFLQATSPRPAPGLPRPARESEHGDPGNRLNAVAAPEKETRAPRARMTGTERRQQLIEIARVAVRRARLRGDVDRGDRAARQCVQTRCLRTLRRQGGAVRGRRRPRDVGAAGRHHVVADQQPVTGPRRTGGPRAAHLRRGAHRRVPHPDSRLAGRPSRRARTPACSTTRSARSRRSSPATSPAGASTPSSHRCTPRHWSGRCR